MRKAARVFVLLLTVLAWLVWSAPLAGAADSETDASQLDGLREAAGEYAPALTEEESVDLDGALLDLVDTGTEALGGVVRPAVRSAVLVLCIVMLCGVAKGAAEEGGRVFQAAPVVGVLAIAAVTTADVHALVGLGRETIRAMAAFSDVLLPTMAAAAAAGGAPMAATARQMATVLFSNLLIRLITQVLIPLVYAYIAASAVHSAVGNPGVQRVAKALKGIVTSVLTAVLLAFTGYLTISGAVAGATDAATVKTAKMAMSSMVPVVGGVLSDAADSVLAGAGMLKNTVGVFGTVTILGLCLLPFLRMGVHYLAYKLSAALSAAVGESRLVELVDAVGSAFGLVLGMTASCAVLLLISLVAGLSASGVV